MTSFLFWNVMNQDLRELITRAASDRNVDILLLAESMVPDDEMARALATPSGILYDPISDEADKVRIYAKSNLGRWRKRQADPLNRMAIWSVSVSKAPSILLAVAHLISKNNNDTEEQGLLAVELSKEIMRAEARVGHERTLVVGDLNMNPFELGVIGANALHAVMTKKIAGRKERTVQGATYPFFYNPMWGFFGDRTVGPAGTYYHRSPRVAELFWHMFDQVLLRPSLMDLLHDLEIIDCIDGQSLLTESAELPQSGVFSDHLPLAFRLDLKRGSHG